MPTCRHGSAADGQATLLQPHSLSISSSPPRGWLFSFATLCRRVPLAALRTKSIRTRVDASYLTPIYASVHQRLPDYDLGQGQRFPTAPDEPPGVCFATGIGGAARWYFTPGLCEEVLCPHREHGMCYGSFARVATSPIASHRLSSSPLNFGRFVFRGNSIPERRNRVGEVQLTPTASSGTSTLPHLSIAET